GPELEARGPIGDLVARGQHQAPGRGAARAQAGEDREPVDLRDHEVEQDGVVGVRLREGEPLLAVARDVDRVAGLPEALGDGAGEGLEVLDQQHPHVESMPRSGSHLALTLPGYSLGVTRRTGARAFALGALAWGALASRRGWAEGEGQGEGQGE